MVGDWLQRLPVLLVDSSVRALIAAGLVAAVLHITRVRSSHTRHRAWCAVLGCMLLMPLLTTTTPGVALTLPAALPVSDVMAWPSYQEPLAQVPSSTVTAPNPPRLIAEAASSSPAAAVAPRRGTDWLQMLSLVYALGALTLLVRLVVGWLSAARLVRTAALTGIEGPAPVKASAHVATPVTIGVLRPVIVLPAAWQQWTAQMLDAVVAHESAHIARRDPLVSFLASCNRCVFWFHPLAWWLEQRLALLAEHACDDHAVRVVQEPRRYAEILLMFAEVVRRHQGRLAWRHLGIQGRGMLEQRLDRLMSGATGADPSRVRSWAVGLLCAAALILVVSCRSQPAPAPLREDPEVAARLAQDKVRQELWRDAAAMTAEQVTALETALEQNPDDFDGLERLQIFYAQSGQKVFGWNAMIERRRPHLLRVIARHPEHNLASSWRVSPEADPVTYREAKALWLAHSKRPDLSASALNNGAYFLGQHDRAIAEEMILRARTLDPDAKTLRLTGSSYPGDFYWTNRLGSFYAAALIGPTSPRDGSPLTTLDSDLYVRDLRQRLSESSDARLLASVGIGLAQRGREATRKQLGTEYLNRALALDPALADARRVLAIAAANDDGVRVQTILRARQGELAGPEIAAKMRASQPLTTEEGKLVRSFEYEAAAGLPEADRLGALAGLASSAYMWAEHLSYTVKDEAGARASWDRSRKAAQDVLALAARSRDLPAYGRSLYEAHVALGAHALRAGDRSAAVQHMRQAVDVPASEALALGMLDGRLVNYLLKEGERDSVAEFLERSATFRASERDRLLADAKAIRAGRMPSSYQYMVARSR